MASVILPDNTTVTYTGFKIFDYKTTFNLNEEYRPSSLTWAKLSKENTLFFDKVFSEDFEYYGITYEVLNNNGSNILTFKDNAIHYARFTFQEFTCDVPFAVSYYDQKLILEKTSSFKNNYYITESGKLNIDVTGLNIYGSYNLNEIIDGQLVYSIEERELSRVYVTCLNPEVDINDLDQTGQTANKYIAYINYYEPNTQQYLSNSFDVFVYKKVPQSLEVEGSDTNTYYDSNISYFAYPEGVTFTSIYNDGTRAEVDKTSLKYYKAKELKEENLLTTETIITNDIKTIYVYQEEYGLWGQYEITFVDDTISSVTLVNNVNIVRGNYLDKYKQDILNAVQVSYSSGSIRMLSEIIGVNNLVIYNNEMIMLDDLTSIEFTFDNNDFTITDLSNVTYTNPIVEAVILNLNGLATEYNSNSTIDFSKVSMRVKYENAVYQDEVTFDTTRITVTSNVGYINIEGNIGTIVNNELVERQDILTFTTTDIFDESSELSVDQEIKIYGITNITNIYISSAYTQYNVGDTFLNENDTTTLTLTLEDGTTIENVRLNSGLAILNINPLKGTKFTHIEENRTVRITYTGNSNVMAEYSINIGAKELSATSTKIYKIVAGWLDRERYIEDYVNSITRTYNIRPYASVGGSGGSGGIEDYANIPYLDKYILVKNGTFDELFEIEELRNQPTTYIDENGIRQLNTGYNLYKTIEAMKEANYFVGYLEDVNNKTVNARVILFNDYVPPIGNESNIIVKYPCYVEGNADYINKCKFGILFGNNNSKNRLFLSGNPDKPNFDWHSNNISSALTNINLNGNFTYFEDTSWCYYGETDNKVIGYDIVSNDKLLVLKDKSDKETTVYFRTPMLVTAISGSGEEQRGLNNEVLYQEEFALVKGNNSVAGVNPNSITNLNGDTLFISDENKVVGLDLEGIVGDNQRYANTRSYHIDEALKKMDLANAKLWTNNNELYLILDNSILMTTKDLLINKQYEWFVMGIPNVNSIIEINGVKYYGTKDGKLYMTNNEYSDIYKTFIGEGGLLATLHVDNYVIYANQKYLESIDLSKKHTFKILPSTKDYMYQQIANVSSIVEDNPMFLVSSDSPYLKLLIKEENDLIKWFNITQEDKDIYFNDIEVIDVANKSIMYNKKYRLVRYYDYESSLDDIFYQVLDENGDQVDVRNIFKATICYKLDEEYDIYDIDLEQSSFKLKYNDYEVDIVRYNAQADTMEVMAIIKEYKDVDCYYITKPYDFGTLNYNKTIYGWALTNDTGIPSWLEVTYTNNKIPYNSTKTLMNVSVDKLSVDFDLLDFRKMDLEKNIVPRVNANYRILPNVNFICFGFRNRGNTNSVLSKMNITYTISSPAYGSK